MTTETLAPAVVSVASGVADIDLASPLPSLADIPSLGARCLVRVAGRPVGIVELAGPTAVLSAGDLARITWSRLQEPITSAVRVHHGAHVSGLTQEGLAGLDATTWPSAPAGEITVVIATRDRPATLQRCLASVLATAPPPAAIVVVDNAPSDDRTARMIADEHAHDPRVTYVVEPRPGLGRAHNAGLPHVRTRYVAFTDDDVLVDPAWIGALGDAFGATGDVACVTGLIAPAELRTQEQWWVERSTGFGKGFERRVRSLRDRDGEGTLFPYDAGTLGSGANMAFSMAFLDEVGGFDPALGTGTVAMGGDDLAALHRVVASGQDLVYEPAAIVFHRHHDHVSALQRQALGYGAGLTAYLTSVLVQDPTRIVDIGRRLVPGIARAFAPSSPLTVRRDRTYPKHLVWRERVGMVSGPFRYLRQRARDRRADRAAS